MLLVGDDICNQSMKWRYEGGSNYLAFWEDAGLILAYVLIGYAALVFRAV